MTNCPGHWSDCQIRVSTFSITITMYNRKNILKHKFLYMPDCPIPLLGQDLLSKLHSQITFIPEKNQLHLQVLVESTCRLQMLLVRKDPTFMLENRLGDSASPA